MRAGVERTEQVFRSALCGMAASAKAAAGLAHSTGRAPIGRFSPPKPRDGEALALPRLGADGGVGYAGEAEEVPVVVDFFGWAEGFLEVVGEFYGGAAVGVGEFANQA
jgi:hypothetical protein